FYDTGVFHIFLYRVTKEIPSMNIIYIAVIIVILPIVWNFTPVYPKNAFKVFMGNIYPAVYYCYNYSLAFVVFNDLIICFLNTHSRNGVLYKICSTPTLQLNLRQVGNF